MAEAEVKFMVPIGLKEEMEKFPEVEWSEIAKETFFLEVKRQVLLRKLDKIFEHSELTDEDALRLGEKVKEAGYKELKEKGLV
ncbi:MAG TPA: hypothetical protein C5S37_08355 [Methanophagales archaeon]|nr:hypothetical protein [Methanophagales archaeon]